MKKSSQRFIAVMMVIIITFSMVPTAFAASAGGETKITYSLNLSLSKMELSFDVYISDEHLKIADVLLEGYGYYKDGKKLYGDITEFIEFLYAPSILTIVSKIPTFLGVGDPIKGPIINYIKSNMPDIEKANVGNGVIIQLRDKKWPVAISQPGPAPKTVKISLSVSPPESGVLSTVNTLNPVQGSSVRVTVQRRSGWIFDGWYEGNTKVSDTQVYKFNAAKDRILEARFKRDGQSTTPATSSTPSQSQLTITNTVNSKFVVTIPANTTVYGYSSSTSTSKLTLYTAKPASYTLYCTKKLTMSDGTTRYFFRSGGATAKDYYLMFTSSMRVEERAASTPTTTPIPEASDRVKVNWDISSTTATTTLQAGKTYEIINNSPDFIDINSNCGDSRRFDGVLFDENGSAWQIMKNSYYQTGLIRVFGKWRQIITVNQSDSIVCSMSTEHHSFLEMYEIKAPTLHSFTLSADKTYEITNDADTHVDICNNGGNERRYDYSLIDTNGNIVQTNVDSYFQGDIRIFSKWKIRITVRTSNIDCYMPYEQVAFLNGIPK